MPKYDVTVFKSTYALITVEAADRDEAKDKAITAALEQEQEWDTGDCQCVNCEEFEE